MAKMGKHQWSARECDLHFVVRQKTLMEPIWKEDSFLKFCFQFPGKNSDNVTRSVPVDVKPSQSLLGKLMLDQPSRMTRYTHLNPKTNSDGWKLHVKKQSVTYQSWPRTFVRWDFNESVRHTMCDYIFYMICFCLLVNVKGRSENFKEKNRNQLAVRLKRNFKEKNSPVRFQTIKYGLH